MSVSLKHAIVSLSLIAPAVAHASPEVRSIADQVPHYFGASDTAGFGDRDLGVIGAGVKDFDALERDLTAMRAQYGADPCTRGNGCLRVVDENGGQTALPSVDDPVARHDATIALAAIGARARTSPLTLIDARARNGTSLVNGIKTLTSPALGLAAGMSTFGVPLSDTTTQGAINSWLTAHPFVFGAPAGAISSPAAIRVGTTFYSSTQPDQTWSGFIDGDILSDGAQIPQLVLDDVAQAPTDTLVAAPALVISRLASEPNRVATKADLMAAASSHFRPVSGSVSRGVFVDGANLLP
jgi:hypothetical protein